MGVRVATANSIGGIKAMVHACALEHALHEQGVKISFRSGSSGGSFAAAALSSQGVRDNGIPWLVERISRIKSADLLDNDLEQQVLDGLRSQFAKRIYKLTGGLVRVGKRKGDRPPLGYYRGNALEDIVCTLLGELGPALTPYSAVSTALDYRTLDDGPHDVAVPLAIASGHNSKVVREFLPGENDCRKVARALRASSSIPFVICPCWVEDHYEVDGGVVSLTSEEVAADWLADNSEGHRPLLIVADLQNLPSQDDNVLGDVFELGLALVRSVGAHIQTVNYQYAFRRITAAQGAGVIHFPAPSVPVPCGQFETHNAIPLFDAYVAAYRKSDPLQRVVETINKLS